MNRTGAYETISLPQTSCFSVARVSLLAVLMIAPLLFGAVETWGWTALTFATALVLSFWAAACAKREVVELWYSPLLIPGTLLLFIGSLQLLLHKTFDPISTRESLIKLTTYLLIFFLTGSLFSRAADKWWNAIGTATTIYAGMLSLFAIFQFFSSPELIYWSIKPNGGGAIFGPYVNHNHYAGLMEMLIPIAAACLLGQQGRHQLRWLRAFAILLAVASVALSGSRGGLIALLVEGVILATLLLRSSVTRRQGLVTILAIAIGGLALFIWLTPPWVMQRYQALMHSPEVSYAQRSQLTTDSLHLFADHRWLGTGLGTFESAYPPYQSIATDEVFNHAHDDYLEIMTDTGMIGLALMVLSLVLFFTTAFSHIQFPCRGSAGCVSLGAALGCCGLLVHSFSDFNLHIPANAAWFAFCAGLSTLKVSSLSSERWTSFAGSKRRHFENSKNKSEQDSEFSQFF